MAVMFNGQILCTRDEHNADYAAAVDFIPSARLKSPHGLKQFFYVSAFANNSHSNHLLHRLSTTKLKAAFASQNSSSNVESIAASSKVHVSFADELMKYDSLPLKIGRGSAQTYIALISVLISFR
jgi:hypothetical protein